MVRKIQNTYKLYIKEAIHKLSEPDMFVTDYVGDVINLLINKPKPYRICYWPYNDTYAIGDAYKYIHGNLEQTAVNDLYIDSEFEDKDILCTFIPYNTINTNWEVSGFVGEREVRTYIKSGIILTSRRLQDMLPDLYNKLKTKGLLTTLTEDSIITILKSYKEELDSLQKEENAQIQALKRAGFKIRPTYKGYCNFKNFLNMQKSNRLGLTNVLYFPEEREERMDFISSYGNDKVPGFDSYVFDDNLTMQRDRYKEIKKLCEENNIPYEVAFRYV